MKTSAEPITFGLGDQIFGNPANDIPDQPKQDHNDGSDAESDDSSSSEDSLIIAMASTRVTDSFWAAAPSYPAMYLSTLSEYIPQPSKAKAPASARIDDPVEADGKAGKDSIWALETYENSSEIDNVFDQFTKRVEFTGEQCLRWVTVLHVDDIWTRPRVCALQIRTSRNPSPFCVGQGFPTTIPCDYPGTSPRHESRLQGRSADKALL